MAEEVTAKTDIAAQTAGPEFSPRITSPYLMGVYMAINAIEDAYLFLDGPSCFPLKSPSIQGNHDWFSDLSSVSGHHKCVTTRLHPSTVVFARDNLYVDVLKEMAGYEGAGGVFVSARPMAAITAVDYERVVSIAQEEIEKPVMVIPPRSLSADWLAGYAEAQFVYAKKVDLGNGSPDPDKVAVVGYLWDRNEGDHLGNLAELERLLAALGLKLEVTWFSGNTFEDLAAVRNAGTIISLPYGRKAAKELATRLDAKLVETVLPFGFGPTERFLRDIGEALGRRDKAEALLETERRKWVPRLEWVIPFVFQTARIGFIGDPHHLSGFVDTLRIVGAEPAFVMLNARKEHLRALPEGLDESLVKFEPTQRFLVDFVPREIREKGLDLLVSSNVGTKLGNVPIMEFGYPSYFTHALTDRPFVGFAGAVGFVENMANTIRHTEFY